MDVFGLSGNCCSIYMGQDCSRPLGTLVEAPGDSAQRNHQATAPAVAVCMEQDRSSPAWDAGQGARSEATPSCALPSVFRRDEGDTGRPFSSAVFLDHGILPLPPAAPRSLALAGSQGGSASLRTGHRCPRIEISSAPSPSFPPDSGIPPRPSMRAGRPRSRDSASGRRYARARVVPVRCPGAAEVTMPTDRPSCQTVWL